MRNSLRDIVSLMSALLICFNLPVHAQDLSFEAMGGTAWNLPMPLKILYPDEEPIKVNARYRTRPFRGAPYYALRFTYVGWSAELLHHKIYLRNPATPVDRFEVSHGYNMATVTRTLDDASIFRIGIGFVVAHPEGEIRGKPIHPVKSFIGGGYHFSGVCLQASAGPRLGLAEHFFLRPEAKLTIAWARVPLADGGTATVPNIAVHTLIGIGYKNPEKD